MFTEFVSLQLSREELQLLHVCLLQRAMLEDELNGAQEKKSSEALDLLAKFEMLLGEKEEALHRLDHVLHDQLWEYSVGAFTDAWVEFRARQEVERALHASRQPGTHAVEKLIEMDYRKHYERYAEEINMEPSKKATVSTAPAKKTS